MKPNTITVFSCSTLPVDENGTNVFPSSSRAMPAWQPNSKKVTLFLHGAFELHISSVVKTGNCSIPNCVSKNGVGMGVGVMVAVGGTGVGVVVGLTVVVGNGDGSRVGTVVAVGLAVGVGATVALPAQARVSARRIMVSENAATRMGLLQAD